MTGFNNKGAWRQIAPRLCLFLLAFFVIAFCLSRPVYAHPHAWISLRTSVIVNDTGEAVAIRQHWLFDSAYSAYASQDFNPRKDGKLSHADLLKLAHENLSNLKSFGYFTVIEDGNGKSVSTGDAKDITSLFESAPHDLRRRISGLLAPKAPPSGDGAASAQKIAMEFTLSLSRPIDLKLRSATYRIYDPTYYVDMAHVEHSAVSFVHDKTGRPVDTCHAKVELPKVDQALIFQAAALDRNATAPKDLGYYFSEKVILSCSPQK
ncbi:MAG: DUF1007 family protein [Bdellovibrionales bacterium]